MSGGYVFLTPAQYPVLFDGRQIVMHIAVVPGGVCGVFLFNGNNVGNCGALTIIAVLCVVKTPMTYINNK